MNLGLNPGFYGTKVYTADRGEERTVLFPSLVGTPDQPHYSMNGHAGIILTEPAHVAVGEEAVEQSRFVARHESSDWVLTDEWYYLVLGALTELTTASGVVLKIVTGLPVAYYDQRKDAVTQRLVGEHRVARKGRHAQTFTIEKALVLPEPYGTAMNEMWDNSLKAVNPDLAEGRVGIIDVGGKTTNLLSLNRFREIGVETDSADVGGWDAMRSLRAWLGENCPDLELKDHEVMQAAIRGWTWYDGRKVDLSSVVAQTTDDLAKQISTVARSLWGNMKALSHIIITGGGAILLGERIAELVSFSNTRIARNPVMANAMGFWKYSVFLSMTSKL